MFSSKFILKYKQSCFHKPDLATELIWVFRGLTTVQAPSRGRQKKYASINVWWKRRRGRRRRRKTRGESGEGGRGHLKSPAEEELLTQPGRSTARKVSLRHFDRFKEQKKNRRQRWPLRNSRCRTCSWPN